MNAINTSADGRSEKPARAALFTAMQRQMGQDTILIVDAMNYIKGFRYQMYCAAREQKIRVCTVRRASFFRTKSMMYLLYISKGLCRGESRAVQRVERLAARWASVRSRHVSPCVRLRQNALLMLTPRERLDNLLLRYEEPSSMVRWDSPLFTVLWTDEDVPVDGIWKAVTEGNVKPPNAGTQAV